MTLSVIFRTCSYLNRYILLNCWIESRASDLDSDLSWIAIVPGEDADNNRSRRK